MDKEKIISEINELKQRFKVEVYLSYSTKGEEYARERYRTWKLVFGKYLSENLPQQLESFKKASRDNYLSQGYAENKLDYFKRCNGRKIESFIDSLIINIENNELFVEPIETITNPTSNQMLDKTKVFIVHGHDELAKVKVARFIESLNLTPIILHENPNQGDTIIEKIEKYTNVGFGIVLYTPCDVGSQVTDQENLKFRARQNVVFEHGFLIGKIGRKNVCALLKKNVEHPNDISGVVYIEFNDDDSWQINLARELKSSGYKIDFNLIIK